MLARSPSDAMARTDPPVAHDRTDVLGQVVRGPQRQVR